MCVADYEVCGYADGAESDQDRQRQKRADQKRIDAERIRILLRLIIASPNCSWVRFDTLLCGTAKIQRAGDRPAVSSLRPATGRYTLTWFAVPTKTFPPATVGTVNFDAWPGLSRRERWLELYKLAPEVSGVVGVQHGRALMRSIVRVIVHRPHDAVAITVGRDTHRAAREMSRWPHFAKRASLTAHSIAKANALMASLCGLIPAPKYRRPFQ